MANPLATAEIKSTVVSLPMDMISIILARLPIKDLARFKSVKKSWYHLISSLHFSHLHSLHHQDLNHEDRICVFVDKDGCLYFFNLDISYSFSPKKIIFPGYSFRTIVGSCNGLLLCTFCVDANHDPENISLILFNPSTGQHKLISSAYSTDTDSTHSYGFGYDFEADDYKIVKIVSSNFVHDMPRKCEVGVFSFKSDSWKVIEHGFSDGFFSPMCGVLIDNHLLNWFHDGSYSHAIWSFDVCTEKWSEVPLPAVIASYVPLNINVFDGRLCLLAHHQGGLFMMDAYGVEDSWVKLFNCPKQIKSGSILPYPLIYSNSGSEILVVAGSRLFWYNTTQKSFKKVQSHNVFPFHATLIMCTRSLAHVPGCGIMPSHD